MNKNNFLPRPPYTLTGSEVLNALLNSNYFTLLSLNHRVDIHPLYAERGGLHFNKSLLTYALLEQPCYYYQQFDSSDKYYRLAIIINFLLAVITNYYYLIFLSDTKKIINAAMVFYSEAVVQALDSKGVQYRYCAIDLTCPFL